MGIGIIIGMGVTGLGCKLISDLLMASGKSTHAQLVDIASMSILITTVIGCVAEAIKALYSLV